MSDKARAIKTPREELLEITTQKAELEMKLYHKLIETLLSEPSITNKVQEIVKLAGLSSLIKKKREPKNDVKKV